MKTYEEIFQRRTRLVAQIESQRMELTQAYRQLEKPIHLGEQALKGFGFLRRNPWVAMAAPGATGLLFSGLGFLFNRGKSKKTAPVDREQIIEALRAEEKSRKKQPVRKALGYAVQAFQLYRRFRPLFPW